MPSEALLPGTNAISRGSVESVPYRGKRLVRYRNLAGYVMQRQFRDPDEAHRYFLECVGRLKEELKTAGW
jgi:hypothetical protein